MILTVAGGQVDTRRSVQRMTPEEIELEIKSLNDMNLAVFDGEPDDSKVPEQERILIDGRHRRIAELEQHLLETKGIGAIRNMALGRREDWGAGVHGSYYVDPRGRVHEVKSLGDDIVGNPQFEQWLRAEKATIMSPDSRFTSPAFEVKSLITGLSETSAGAMVPHEWSGIVDLGKNVRPLVLTDLITILQTQRDAVDFVRTTFTNAAAETLEAVSQVTGAKPESAVAFALVPVLIESIAHWIAVTRRAVADAKELKGIINKLGLYGLEERVDTQIINGSGVTPNLLGLIAMLAQAPAIANQAFDTDIIKTSRKAMTRVRVDGKATATATVLSPGDMEDLDLAVDLAGRYYGAGPTGAGFTRLWAKPVIESQALADGVGFVGDWRLAVLWDREQSTMRMTDSHADFFIRNILVMLFEMRAGLGWLRREAFKGFATA